MQIELTDSISKLGRTAIDSATRLGDMNARVFQRLAEHHVNATKACLESGIKQLKVVGEAKSYEQIVSQQSRIIAEVGETLMNEAKETVDTLVEAKDELSGWVGEGIETMGVSASSKRS